MTGENNNTDGQGGGAISVAEYVLGVLDADQHAEMARLIAADPSLQAEEQFWVSRLEGLNEDFAKVTPPLAVFEKIESRLFGEPQKTSLFAGLWNNINLWRGFAAAGLAAIVLAIGLNMFTPVPQPSQPQLVASLSAEQSEVKFLALYDGDTGTVRLSAQSGDAVPDRDFELWFIAGQQAPVSLGLVPVDGSIEVVLPDTVRQQVGQGIVLAVTLEPLGGAPDGAPTGPIVAAGALSLV